MKIIKHLTAQMMVLLLISLNACDLECNPYNQKQDSGLAETVEGAQTLTLGVYANLVNREYTKNQHQLGAMMGDDFALSGNTGDQLRYTYQYAHTQRQGNSNQFWGRVYRTIYAANSIIEKIPDNASAELLQLKGELLYIRAMAHFDCVRVFGRPYTQDGTGSFPGIPIKTTTESGELPRRNTVKEVYDQIIDDLLKAASLMYESKNSCYASKEVAYALLSRVYLYKEDNENALEYANKVINSNRYQLLDTEAFKTYNTLSPENNRECIFAIKHTINENRGTDAIGSMYYADAEGSGWAEIYCSETLYNIMRANPEDVRNVFIIPQYDAEGNLRYRGGVPRYYVTKYNYQDGVVNLCSPIYIRLADIYLIRAEANAKLGNYQDAINDVNHIRERAGYSGDGLYTVNNLKGQPTVLDVILHERFLELAFEGQRAYDLFRNKRPMVRAYNGFHGSNNFDQTIPYDHPRVVHYIPEQERNVNPNLENNPS